VVTSYYPELVDPLTAPMQPGDEPLDVLVLAGSAFFHWYGKPGDFLATELRKRIPRPIVVHNMGRPAHTTRDSLIKMRWLADRPWDLVVVYHGINDLRANNIPPERFRADYGHLRWFAEVNRVAAAPGPWFALGVRPFLGWAAFGRWRLTEGRGLPDHDLPLPAWVGYGADLRSADCFEANLREIAALARERGIPLVICTYASHLDPHYSEQALLAGREALKEHRPWVSPMGYERPPYADYAQPVEIWGKPANVLAGMAEHNRRARKVAADSGAELADVAGAVPAESRFFIDICHFSPYGVQVLTQTVAEAAVHALERDRPEMARKPRP
jgi:hypothetical protein